MSYLEFDILQKNNSPRSIRFKNNDGTICLFDTGANYPVWCTGLNTLLVQYPNAYMVKGVEGYIMGFGGSGTKSVIYCIPELRLSNNKEALLISNMWVAVYNRDFDCDLILGYPLF